MIEPQQLKEDGQLLSQKRFNLLFSKQIESAYQGQLKHDFLITNEKLVTFGVFFYAFFLVADYIFYPKQFMVLTVFRLSIVVVCLVALYNTYIKKNHQHIIRVTLSCIIAMGAQMFVSGMLFFEQPVDIMYAIGVFPIMVYGIILFQYCFKETAIVVLTLFGGLLLTIATSYPFNQMNSQLFSMFIIAMPLMVLFAATICVMGIYTAYSMEKLKRKEWLKNQLLQAESQKLNNLTNKLQVLSVTDGLTGLYNRRFFDEKLLQNWQHCKAADQPISLIMVDADWFKVYNDTYGHQAGDDCLKAISSCLLNQSPDEAIIARYGGEEFIIILPNIPLNTALSLAKKLCHAIFQLKIPHENSPFHYCSVSLGVDTHYPAEKTPKTAEADSGWVLQFLQHVDSALYAAKAKGKNQVCVYQPKENT